MPAVISRIPVKSATESTASLRGKGRRLLPEAERPETAVGLEACAICRERSTSALENAATAARRNNARNAKKLGLAESSAAATSSSMAMTRTQAKSRGVVAERILTTARKHTRWAVAVRNDPET